MRGLVTGGATGIVRGADPDGGVDLGGVFGAGLTAVVSSFSGGRAISPAATDVSVAEPDADRFSEARRCNNKIPITAISAATATAVINRALNPKRCSATTAAWPTGASGTAGAEWRGSSGVAAADSGSHRAGRSVREHRVMRRDCIASALQSRARPPMRAPGGRRRARARRRLRAAPTTFPRTAGRSYARRYTHQARHRRRATLDRAR